MMSPDCNHTNTVAIISGVPAGPMAAGLGLLEWIAADSA
jgi:hypothetical protein